MTAFLYFKKSVFLFSAIVAFFIIVVRAEAVSLSFLSQPASIQLNDLVTVRLTLSAEKPANAVAATIVYPPESLELISMSRTGSVVDFWVQEPRSTPGSILFEGIMNNSFVGTQGKVIEMTFRGKRGGSVALALRDAEVLAADGQGTSILEDAGVGIVLIGGTGSQSPSLGTIDSSDRPVVASLTHPRSTSWYGGSSPVFQWSTPSGARGSSYSISRSPENPGTVLRTSGNRVNIAKVEDGIHFFNVRVQRADGTWGPYSSYEFRVDATPPEAFSITFPHGETSEDPRPVALFNTKDKSSGIAYYEVVLNNSTVRKLAVAEVVASNPYALPEQQPGTHEVLVRAYDAAGNLSTAKKTITITSIHPPSIRIFDNRIEKGDQLRIIGETYPAGIVTIHIIANDHITLTREIVADEQGKFDVVFDEVLSDGSYLVAAKVVSGKGSESEFTDSLSFTVGSSIPNILGILNDMTSYWWILIVVIIVALAAGLNMLWERRYLDRLSKELSGRSREENPSVENAQTDQVIEQIQELEQAMTTRALTKEEVHILSRLRLQLSHLMQRESDKNHKRSY